MSPVLSSLTVAALDWNATVVEPVIQTVALGAVAILLLFLSVWLMERLTPFSLHKEIVEDHNTSASIVIGAVVIGVAIVIAAVAGG